MDCFCSFRRVAMTAFVCFVVAGILGSTGGCSRSRSPEASPAAAVSPGRPGLSPEEGQGLPSQELQSENSNTEASTVAADDSSSSRSSKGQPADTADPTHGGSSGNSQDSANDGPQLATFGAGCFWCVEAVFEQLDGVDVDSVKSGYAGGSSENASYSLVSRGTTGHAEVIQFEFDPAVISYEELLQVFWTSHDPTTPNRQGYDVGPQYRSVVMHHNEHQKQTAERLKKKLNEEDAFGAPVVTEIVPFEGFYTAENYHQNYFAQNSSKPYCRRIIQPKLEKVRKVFQDKLREPAGSQKPDPAATGK